MTTAWPKHKDKKGYITCNYCTLQTNKTIKMKTKTKKLIDATPYVKGLGGWIFTHCCGLKRYQSNRPVSLMKRKVNSRTSEERTRLRLAFQ